MVLSDLVREPMPRFFINIEGEWAWHDPAGFDLADAEEAWPEALHPSRTRCLTQAAFANAKLGA